MTRAALRDASWYRNPSTDKPVRYHIVREDVHKGEGACGIAVLHATSRTVLDETLDAADVPLNLRCQRPGCKQRWPAGVAPSPAPAAPPEHVCGLQGFGALGDECPACTYWREKREGKDGVKEVSRG
jgi:hypothetical protein